MKISIITVTRNCAETLPKTLESFLAQSSDDFEVVVVDGASNDGTCDILLSFAPRFGGRLRFVTEPDNGIYDAINKGVRMARGTFLLVIGSGDWLEKNAIQNLCHTIVQHPHCDAVYGVLRVWNPDCTKSYLSQSRPFLLPILPLQHPALCYRKNLHGTYGLYDTSYKVAADYLFCLKAFYKGSASTVRRTFVVDNFVTGGASSDNRVSVSDRMRISALFAFCSMHVGFLWFYVYVRNYSAFMYARLFRDGHYTRF